MNFYGKLYVFLVMLTLILLENRINARPMSRTEVEKYVEILPGVKNKDEIIVGQRRLIGTPQFGFLDCPQGQKKDRKGRCRQIFI